MLKLKDKKITACTQRHFKQWYTNESSSSFLFFFIFVPVDKILKFKKKKKVQALAFGERSLPSWLEGISAVPSDSARVSALRAGFRLHFQIDRQVLLKRVILGKNTSADLILCGFGLFFPQSMFKRESETNLFRPKAVNNLLLWRQACS